MESKKTLLKFIRPNLIPSIIALVIFPIGTLIGLLYLLCNCLPAWLSANKSIAALESKGELDKAAAELASPNAKKLVKEKVILTDNYVFCKGTGAILTYDQIQWAYMHRQRTTFLFIPIKVTDSLYLGVNGKKVGCYASMGKDKNEEIKDTIVTIYSHNPNCLVGFTKENQAKFKALSK